MIKNIFIENNLDRNLYFGILDQIITNALAPPITLPLSITWILLNNSFWDFEVSLIASSLFVISTHSILLLDIFFNLPKNNFIFVN